jgi:hypothetical protein
LSPARYEALKQRVDLQFAPQNPRFFGANESVALDLRIKNVGTLIVNIYEINAFNYYRGNLTEIDAGIDLGGLVATHAETVTYDTPPLRRVRRTFDLPQLAKPGVYVVEFIGNGKSSRALVRKGALRCIQRPGSAGHVFMIWDDEQQRRTNATIWLAGQEYHANAAGVVIVPFSATPGRTTAILRDGALSSLVSFEHAAESYRLNAGFYVDRETLLRDARAALVVRPTLTVAGQPISVDILDNVSLVITAIDQDAIASSSELTDLHLSDDAETVHWFQVPPRLASLRITLKARVTSLSTGKPEDLSASEQFSLNSIDGTTATEQLLLSRDDSGYLLSLRGKNGEVRPNRPIQLTFNHRLVALPRSLVLQTDAHGDVRLGALNDIATFTAGVANGRSFRWQLMQPWYRYPSLWQGRAGVPLRIPWGDTPATPRRAFCLLALRNGAYVTDLTEQAALRDGFLVTPPLEPGDYELYVKPEAATVRIQVTDGREQDGVVLSPHRLLEVSDTPPLQITGIAADNDGVRVTLSRTDAWTRVHVIATRFVPDINPFTHLACMQPPALIGLRPVRFETRYLAERAIGDEYQYILDRRRTPRHPGNLLTRPGLLLNPWSISKTITTAAEAAEADKLSAMPEAVTADRMREAAKRQIAKQPSIYNTLDFLAQPARVLLNLRPDAHGVVRVPPDELAGFRQVHVLAVDPLHTVYRQAAFAPVDPVTRDLRLANGLDPSGTFSQQKLISTVVSGQTVRLPDRTTCEFESYDSIGKAYQLLATLCDDAALREFSFITTWPALTKEEQRSKYATYACHELNMFLYHKDRAFFDAVIKPYLRNKKDKRVLDRWLLEEDLTAFLQPWAYDQLNAVERILLAQRGPDTPARMRRAIQDQCDLLPPDPDEYNLLFDTALHGRALELAAEWGGRGLGEYSAFSDREQVEKQALMRGVVATDVPSGAPAPPPGPPRAADAAQAPSDRKDMSIAGLALDRLAARDDRSRVRALYRPPEKTEEWAENNYYHRRIQEQNATLVPVNLFWNDYAQYDGNGPFLSRNLAYAAGNFSEAMLALAVIDLPFTAAAHTAIVSDTAVTLTAAGPLILYHKEINAGAPTNSAPLLLSQQFFNPLDRYEYDGNERVEKFITDEFLAFTPYGASVALSNPGGQRRNVNVLLQLPVGAMPLQDGFYTRGIPLTLEPHSTRTFEYYFYFPTTGVFQQLPAQVAERECCIASATPATFTVHFTPAAIDTGSWQYVSQNGSLDNVLVFLHNHNLYRLDLQKLAFRMKDAQAFETILSLLNERHIYNHDLWAYSLLHNQSAALGQYLAHSPLAEHCGAYFASPLLTIDPIERRTGEHLEYAPLINARAHQLGPQRRILNDRFFAQFQRLMDILCCRPQLDDEDRLAVVYYLLLQDRIEAARALFAAADPTMLAERLQYDYIATYLAFSAGDVAGARTIAERYREYPVPRWRALFADARAQLDEIVGAPPVLTDEQDRGQRQTVLAAAEPALDLSIEGRTVTLDYRNLDACRVNYYPMDIELLFSRNPFVRQQGDQFACVTPQLSVALPLATNQQRTTFEVPERFRTGNVLIEAAAGPLAKTQVYYANDLDAQVFENYGMLHVRHRVTHAPLSAVYVKVYARMHDGSVAFYKDGYTDLRGKFDYVSLSTDDLDRVARFALLVMSEKDGALIREASPPKR